MAGVVALGTLYCFLGYRTLRFVIALTGFLVAGAVAGVLVLWIARGNELAALVGLAVGGICGAFALWFLYKAGIFLLGMLGAGLIGNYAMEPADAAWVPLAVLAIALVGGLVALVLEKPVMLTATSVLGAWMLVAAGAYFILGGGELQVIADALEAEDSRQIILALWALLAGAGILSQFATTRGRTVVVKKPAASNG